jgi:hypothetical protein
MFAFKTLQRRLTILLVAPLTLFLLGFGFFGYRFIQGLLFEEWREVAILRLQRAAHQMDMRLHEQMHWMGLFAQAGQDPQGQMIQSWILQQLQAQPGVRLTGREGAPGPEAGPRSAGAFKPGSRASPSR